ncbi:hypothetical protein Tco_0152259 [Tanacetum coccineum]
MRETCVDLQSQGNYTLFRETMALPVQNTNHSAFRSMFEREKLSGNNFNEWFARLKLVLRVEKKMHVIEQPLPPAHEPVVELNVVDQWTALYDAHTEIACLMLGSMTPELHRQFELRPIRNRSNAKGKNKVKGKGKDKKDYTPKPKNPKPTAMERPAKDDACHHCKEGFRIERKLKQGALYLYVGNGVRAQVEAIGSFDLVLPNGLVICLDNCHYAPTITRGVVSVSHLVDNGFVQCFTDYGISVSKNGIVNYCGLGVISFKPKGCRGLSIALMISYNKLDLEIDVKGAQVYDSQEIWEAVGFLKQVSTAFKLKELDKSEEPKALLSVDSMLNWSDHKGEDEEKGVAQVYGMIAGDDNDAAGDVSDAAAEFALMGLSSQDLEKLLDQMRCLISLPLASLTPQMRDVEGGGKPLYDSDKSSDSETTGFASCVSSVKSSSSKTNEHLASASSSVDFKTVSKTADQKPSSTIDDPSFSFKENVKTPRNICNKSGINNRSHCKNNSFGSKTMLCFVQIFLICSLEQHMFRLVVGSPAYVSAGSAFLAGIRNRPASVSAGRPFSAGWRNHAA